VHPPNPGLLVAHGRLARELLTTAESIAGPAPDVVCLSNDGKTPESLAGEIAAALEGMPSVPVILVDLAGGSCLQAVRRAVPYRPEIPVAAGMNLPLVLDFLQNRATLSGGGLLEHLLERGRTGIRRLPEI